MTSDFEVAKAALSIQSVNMAGCNVALKQDFDPESIRQVSMQIQGFYGVNRISEDELSADGKVPLWRYRFFFISVMRTIPVDVKVDITEDTDFYVKIEAEFCAIYLSNDKLTQEQQLAFAHNKNVGYHVWPYWREFVQSTCAKLNIPVITVPHYLCNENKQGDNPKASQ